MKKLAALIYLLLMVPASATINCSLPFTLTNGTIADATQVMANYQALVTCFTQAASAGANTDITSLSGLTVPVTPNAGGSNRYIGGTSGGTANAQTISSTTPTNFLLTTGFSVVFLSGFTNTGPTTIDVAGQGPRFILLPSPSGPINLLGGEIQAGTVTEIVYDGTSFELTTVASQFGGFGPRVSLASGSATPLGNISTHNVLVTGNTTITSFGNNASLTFPVYLVTFNGALQITYNATNCVTVGGCILIPGGANITTAGGDSALLLFGGLSTGGIGNWQIIQYQRLNGTAIVNPTPLCGANGLTITNNAGSPNNEVDITADSVVMVAAGNVSIYATSVTVTINDTINGANGLDVGALANNTFYHHYLISNGNTTAGLDSASATAPILPSGYTYFCRLGASKTNGAAAFYGFVTKGNSTQYLVGGNGLPNSPLIANGVQGGTCNTAVSWQAVTIRGASGAAPIWVPPTATYVHVIAMSEYNAGTQSFYAIAPSTNYAGGQTMNPAPIVGGSGVGSQSDWFQLESDSIQVCGTAAGFGAMVMGWKEKVNAN